MDLVLILVIAVVITALVFDYTNGFHDAANAIATSVSTRALTPRAALVMAASLNFVGALLGQQVAQTIQGIIAIDEHVSGNIPDEAKIFGLAVVGCAVIGAITWNMITWYFGIPSSSTHALIGGIAGAGIASGIAVHWGEIGLKVGIPMILSPLLGFMLAYAFMTSIMWTFRRANPHKVARGFRLSQTLSAAAMSLGHGLQDAQKTMGVIVLALIAGGYYEVGVDEGVPLWVIIAAATAIALGTYAGGWRIMRTLGRRIIDLDPPKGFAAEGTAATVLFVMAMGAGAPVSTTHTITSAIMGSGATKRFSAVRWGVARSIVTAWVITMPAAAFVGATSFLIVNALFL